MTRLVMNPHHEVREFVGRVAGIHEYISACLSRSFRSREHRIFVTKKIAI